MRAARCTGGCTCLTDASRTHLALKKEKFTLLMALPIPELGMQYKYGGI